MSNFFNKNNDSFLKYLNARLYVDKSIFINFTNSVLKSTDGFLCVTRPRRFGKPLAI